MGISLPDCILESDNTREIWASAIQKKQRCYQQKNYGKIQLNIGEEYENKASKHGTKTQIHKHTNQKTRPTTTHMHTNNEYKHMKKSDTQNRHIYTEYTQTQTNSKTHSPKNTNTKQRHTRSATRKYTNTQPTKNNRNHVKRKYTQTAKHNQQMDN